MSEPEERIWDKNTKTISVKCEDYKPSVKILEKIVDECNGNLTFLVEGMSFTTAGYVFKIVVSKKEFESSIVGEKLEFSLKRLMKIVDTTETI